MKKNTFKKKIPKKHKLPCIYKATSKTTGKSYIGQSIKGLRSRKSSHLCDTQRNTYSLLSKFHKAIIDLGPKDFIWGILYVIRNKNLTEKEILDILNEKEIYYINEFNSYKEGYNSNSGGGNNLSIKWSSSTLEGIHQEKLARRRQIREETYRLHPEKRLERLTLEKKVKAKQRRQRPHRIKHRIEYKAKNQERDTIRKREYRKSHPEYMDKLRKRCRERNKLKAKLKKLDI